MATKEAILGAFKYDEDNPILYTDGYKPTHWPMYPANMTELQSYFESRAGAKHPYTVFFGLQYFLMRYFSGVVVTTERIEQADRYFKRYYDRDKVWDRGMWEHIRDTHGGKLPLRIKALPEGTKVPTGNAMMLIESTDERCAPLANYVETAFVQVW